MKRYIKNFIPDFRCQKGHDVPKTLINTGVEIVETKVIIIKELRK